jgi:hypothetical protein
MIPAGSFMENAISSFQTGLRQLLMTFVFAVCSVKRRKHVLDLTEEALHPLRKRRLSSQAELH